MSLAEEGLSETATEEQATLPPLEPLSVDPAEEEIVSATSAPDSIGFVTYFPSTGGMGALAGTNEFTLYFEKPDIKIGLGKVELYNAATNALVDSIEVSEENKCVLSPLDSNGQMLTDWVEGTKAELYFNTFFEPGESYYVLMDKGCFMNGEIASKGIDNASYMKFDVKPYGINGIFRDIYNFGDTINLDVLLGGEAVRAAVLDYDASMMNIPQNVFTAQGTNSFMLTFQSAGKASFRLAFFDNKGAEIDSVTFSADVMGTAGGAVYSDEGDTLTVEQATPTDTPNHIDTGSSGTPAVAVKIQDNTASSEEE